MLRFSLRQLTVVIALIAIYFAIATRGWLKPLVPLHFIAVFAVPLGLWLAVRKNRIRRRVAYATHALLVATLFFELYLYEMIGSLIVLIVVLPLLPLLPFVFMLNPRRSTDMGR